VSEQTDPRLRPPDPAGTQPKFDPKSLSPGQNTFLPAPTATPPEPSPIQPQASAPVAAQHPHAPRFQFLFGALGALGVCAVALLVMLLSAPKSTPGKPWATWHPADSGVDPAQQIAAHVAPEYELDNGKQIVQVSGGPPALKGRPLTLGLWRSGQQPARLEGNSVLYRLCGGGTNCSIKEGKASLQRGMLLHREALELALYTFHYVGGVDQVIVTIPPPPPTPAKRERGKSAAAGATTAGTGAAGNGSSPASSTTASTPVFHALMFRHQDVASELGQPLSASLSPVAPRVSQMERSAEAPLVKLLTEPRFYDYVVDESTQNGPVMLLEPPSS
jgi:hypothetical protein